MPDILAFDLGGSSLRIAIVGEDGEFRASVRKPLSIRTIGARGHEADPADWWDAFVEGCADLAGQGQDFSRIGAIAGCGFTRTQVFLDERGAVLRPAIAFQDSRAGGLLSAPSGASAAIRDVLASLGPFDPLARLLWLKAGEADIWDRLGKMLEPKDYINLRLTGIACSDRISQTPMRRVLDSAPGILGALGIDPAILPDIQSPFDELGHVWPGLPYPIAALEGVPVYCGSIDTWACVLGSGGLTPGVAYGISGTSDVSGVISAERCQAAGLLTVEWGPGLWQLGGPSQGAATRLQWVLDRFAPDAELKDALGKALASQASAPLVLPYLGGERTPWWDAGLSGAILGLGVEHDASDLLRGMAEGINYLAREILTRAEDATGVPVRHVCFSGGLSGSGAFCQLKADVLNRPVVVPANGETGLVGAARVARQAMGLGAETSADDARLYEPDPARRRYHDARFAHFLDATEATRSWS